MTTATQIIGSALRRLGVLDPSENLEATMAETGLIDLNALLSAWKLSKLYVYTWTNTTFNLIPGQATYTFGPTGDFVIAQKPSLFDDYATIRSTVDYIVEMISGTAYSTFTYKQTAMPVPEYAYYDAGSGRIVFYGTPSSNYPITFRIGVTTGSFADLTTDYDLPDGYERAISLSLAEDLAESYGRPFSPRSMAQAKAARDVLRRSNLEVPTLVW